jgi:hypothetical protein
MSTPPGHLLFPPLPVGSSAIVAHRSHLSSRFRMRPAAQRLGRGVRTLYRGTEAGYSPRPLRASPARRMRRGRKAVGEAGLRDHSG